MFQTLKLWRLLFYKLNVKIRNFQPNQTIFKNYNKRIIQFSILHVYFYKCWYHQYLKFFHYYFKLLILMNYLVSFGDWYCNSVYKNICRDSWFYWWHTRSWKLICLSLKQETYVVTEYQSHFWSHQRTEDLGQTDTQKIWRDKHIQWETKLQSIGIGKKKHRPKRQSNPHNQM